MCTYYRQEQGKAERYFRRKDAEAKTAKGAAGELVDVRPTLPAPVVTADRVIEDMSWGFRRRFKLKSGKMSAWKPVVNTRDDKLDSSTWRDAYRERRCIAPVSEFFEWSGPAGLKVTHRFSHPDGEMLWVAGIWEESEEFGRCFSLLTTEPNREVGKVHDRMLVVLVAEEIESWLDGFGFESFRRPDGMLAVMSGVSNPLRGGGPEQGELL